MLGRTSILFLGFIAAGYTLVSSAQAALSSTPQSQGDGWGD